MAALDWIILCGTIAFIVGYGVWKTRSTSSVESYLLGDRDLKWWTIGLSIMATQASAITFLSTPGQAFNDGMGFAQFYFGLPIAMVFLCVFVLPIYYNLKVYTAYEYLEGRFDLKTRTLTAILFLIQRGLAAGLTIYAPAIILSKIVGWNLGWTTFVIGIIVIFYTVIGGTKAVSQTQKQQMIIILTGMFIAFFIIVFKLKDNGVSFGDAVGVAGKMGKLEIVDFSFDLSKRYTFWTGILGGVFLFLSYFGTDQSQVQRYLSGKSLTESRLGLLFNGIFKVPMQFFILFVGIMVFIFYQFQQPPLHFNEANIDALKGTQYEVIYNDLEADYDIVFSEKQTEIKNMIVALDEEDEPRIALLKTKVDNLMNKEIALRDSVKSLVSARAKELPEKMDSEDRDYVFISFVMENLPIGLVGLLLAVIFSAAMSSTSSELNALATTTVVDLYKRNQKKERTEAHYLNASRGFTIMWGLIALGFAAVANLFDNLIQAVNTLGSLFYGAILGVFLVAFFLKKVKGNAVFISALIGELIVITIYILSQTGYINIAYLWLNLIGCVIVMLLAVIIQRLWFDTPES